MPRLLVSSARIGLPAVSTPSPDKLACQDCKITCCCECRVQQERAKHAVANGGSSDVASGNPAAASTAAPVVEEEAAEVSCGVAHQGAGPRAVAWCKAAVLCKRWS